MKNIYVVGNSVDYANWMDGRIIYNINKADLVVFTGGEDVHPSFYGEPLGKHTQSNIQRDLLEVEMWKRATDLNKHIIGICRGSQLACALSGGRLIQHQDNPQSRHAITTFDGLSIPITSSHHQAQFPYLMKEDEYKLLAYTEGMSPYHLDGTNKEISDKPFKEAEVVYYPKTKALGIQGHPEWMNPKVSIDTFAWLNIILERHLEDSL